MFLLQSLFHNHTIRLNHGEIVYSPKEKNGVPPLPQNVSLSFMEFLFWMKGYFLLQIMHPWLISQCQEQRDTKCQPSSIEGMEPCLLLTQILFSKQSVVPFREDKPGDMDQNHNGNNIFPCRQWLYPLKGNYLFPHSYKKRATRPCLVQVPNHYYTHFHTKSTPKVNGYLTKLQALTSSLSVALLHHHDSQRYVQFYVCSSFAFSKMLPNHDV